MGRQGFDEDAKRLLQQLEHRSPPIDRDADLVVIDDFLKRCDAAPTSQSLVADLLIQKAWTYAMCDEHDEALETLEEVIGRYDRDTQPNVIHAVAFARLRKARVLFALGEVDQAVTVCQQLAGTFESTQDDQTRGGIGLMLVDLAFLMLANERPEAVLRICEPIAVSLRELGPWYQAVAAGALFYSAQAHGRLGQTVEANEDITNLRQIGEPALSGLHRIAKQFGPYKSNPAWHLQINTYRAVILAELGRHDEARAIWDEVMKRTRERDLPAEAVAELASLGRELMEDR